MSFTQVNIENDAKETGIAEDYLKRIQSFQKPILESIGKDTLINFRHYNERYYEDKYSINFYAKNYPDILVRVHTNKVLLIALAKGNSIMQSDKNISEISFIVNGSDRANLKIKGKKKKGAKILEKDTILCKVKLEEESEWREIRSGVKGLLVEINHLVKVKPNLLKTDPKGLGYLAVVLPKGPISETEKAVDNLELISEEDYFNYIKTRSSNN